MIKTGSWRVFLAGALCGTVLTVAVGAAWLWWKRADAWPNVSESDTDVGLYHSDKDQNIYDLCLADGRGRVACDALMRLIARDRAEKEKPAFDPSRPFTPVR
jgi:hypothetical protein